MRLTKKCLPLLYNAGNGKYFPGSLVVTDGYMTCFWLISHKWQVPGKASAFLRKEIQKFPSHLPAARMQPQCLELLQSATLWQYFATWCKELTHLKRPWCWERLRAGGEGGDTGWDGWMASPTQWTWVWVDPSSWWWTGRPGLLWFMGLQGVGHGWVTG